MRRGAVAEHADIWGQDNRPELADVARMARRLVRQAVLTARAEDGPVQRVLREHLGPDAAGPPVVSGTRRGSYPGNGQARPGPPLAPPPPRPPPPPLTPVPHLDFTLR